MKIKPILNGLDVHHKGIIFKVELFNDYHIVNKPTFCYIDNSFNEVEERELFEKWIEVSNYLKDLFENDEIL
jgi:hypothetical protein